MPAHFSLSARVGVVAALVFGGLASAQQAPTAYVHETPGASSTQVPDWARGLAIDPASNEARAYAEQQKQRLAAEKAIRKIRAKYLRSGGQALRQEGILQLQAYADPAYFPLLIDLFQDEALDVRSAVLDIFAEQRGDAGDAALAWVGVFDAKREVRALALDRLNTRIQQEGGRVPDPVKAVVYEGLASRKTKSMYRAAAMANHLTILEAIPWLIAGQVSSRPAAGGSGAGQNESRNGALAYIIVGRQTAFVSDLTPVVGPSSVAFDPQLSVITEGTVLRVIDAAVYEYHIEINRELVDLTSRVWGQSTAEYGWNQPEWARWYREQFKPEMAARAKAQADREALEAAEAAARKSDPIPSTPGGD